jgi:hypothetical protein
MQSILSLGVCETPQFCDAVFTCRLADHFLCIHHLITSVSSDEGLLTPCRWSSNTRRFEQSQCRQQSSGIFLGLLDPEDDADAKIL